MSSSRFDPPQAPVIDPPSETLSWTVAWLAACAAIGAAYLVGSMLSPLLQHALAGGAATESAVYQALLASPWFMAVTMILGIGGYVFGGYIAASHSSTQPVRHALAAGLICIIIGLVGYLGRVQSPFPYWWQVLAFLVTWPSVYVGARWSIAVRSKRGSGR